MLFRGDCMNIGCVIMASGLGKRFGGNKLLCDFHGEPMIQRILDATGAVPFAGRVVVTRYPEVAQIRQFQRISCVLHDLPLRSDTVRLGVERLSADCPELDGILFAAADQPRLKAERIAALCGAFRENPISICRLSFQGTPGSPVLFPRHCFDELLHLPEGKGGSAIIKAHPELVRLIEVSDPRELMDADTPQALEQLL